MKNKSYTGILFLMSLVQLGLMVLGMSLEGTPQLLVLAASFGMMGLYVWINKKMAKEKERELAQNPDNPPDFLPEKVDGSHSVLLLIDVLTGGMYYLVREGERYLLMKVGGELRGITDTELEPRMYSAAVLEEKKVKHFFLNGREMTYSFRPFRNTTIAQENSGTLRLSWRNNKKSFAVLGTLTPEEVAAFFPGIPNRTSGRVKQKTEKEEQIRAWLEREQDPEKMKKLKFVHWGLNGLTMVTAFFFLFAPSGFYKPLSVLSMVCFGACLVLDILWPAYFSLVEDPKDAKRKNRKPRYCLMLPVLLSTASPTLRTVMDFTFLNMGEWGEIGLWLCGFVTVVCLILGLFAREFRHNKGELVALGFLLLMFGMGFVGQTNYLLDTGEKTVTQNTVLDTRVSSGRTTTYYCTVELPDGTELDVAVSKEMYKTLKAGEKVTLVTCPGGLGISYVFVVSSGS